MCERRHGRIYRGCKEAMLKATGRQSMSNREMYLLLRQSHDGCMNGRIASIDKKGKTVQG